MINRQAFGTGRKQCGIDYLALASTWNVAEPVLQNKRNMSFHKIKTNQANFITLIFVASAQD
jgi:hypothetical protein